MITLKTLAWSNAFSYGADNIIDFTASPLVQLVGKNGHGKSSIALILEEVLFNKNSKGIKKGNILNRHVTDKAYNIALDFDKDGVAYRIETRRGATQTVKLLEAGVDISAHTSTGTYSLIEQIIGMDHKTFSQIVYQSHASSLEFLTSPDTARKKFLIELLNLTKYTKAGEVFKDLASQVSKDMAVAQGKVDTVNQWISKYNKIDFTPKSLLDLPDSTDGLASEAAALEAKLSTLEQENKRIAQNNTYKTLQAKITVLPLPEKPSEDPEPYNKHKIEATQRAKTAETLKAKLAGLHGRCPTCLSEINDEIIAGIVTEQDVIISESLDTAELAGAKYAELLAAKTAWERAQKSQEDWEKYHQLIDTTMPETPADAAELSTKLAQLQSTIKTTRAEIARIEKHNSEATLHNNKLALIEGQLAEMTAELESWSVTLAEHSSKLESLNVLVKTFSTTGLVAYKIENLVKDLEELANAYLGELSGGRFQISFQIAGSDKLNVVVTDNGIDIDISALSGGEKARVNVATLLAIRRLMQSLSQARINLLILDETVETLDVDGKEKLIEVLLNEDSLNTVLVSHGFSHPLLEKVFVVKHNNISRIEV